MSKKIFVGNLSYQTTEGDLSNLFEQVGQVSTGGLQHAAHNQQTYPWVQSLANLLRAGGYWTGLIGKFHVGPASVYNFHSVLTKGTAKGNDIGRPAAGKTGTVDNFSSAWFAGYTPDMASAVWVGDPRGGYKHPLRDVCLGEGCFGQVYGADVPAPIWRDTMTEALRDVPEHSFNAPEGGFYRKGSGEEEEDKDKKDKDKDKDKDKKGDKPGHDDEAAEPPNSDWLFPP